MDAVILSAGFGKRLMPFTRIYQKVGLGVYSIPPVLYQLYNLSRKGVERFFINLHHNKSALKQMVMRFCPQDMDIRFSEEETILGTGGSLYSLQKELTDDFLVVNGDTYLDIDYNNFYDFFRNKRCLAALMLGQRHNRDVSGIGVDNEYISVIDIEKRSDFPNMFYGCHIISKDIFGYFSKEGYSDIIRDLYSFLIKKRMIAGYITNKPLFEIGSFNNIRDGLRILLESGFTAINLRDFCLHDPDNNSLFFNSRPSGGSCIKNSTVSYDVRISEGAKIINSVIMQNNTISSGMVIIDQIVPPMQY